MAIAARTATKGTAASGAGFTITFATGSAAGDVVVLFVANAGTSGPAAPTGWTRYRNADSAGTGQSITTFTAPWSAGLTATFTNAASAAAWTCNSYSGGNASIKTDGAGAASSATTNNANIPVGNPTTGSVSGDYEVLGYAWTSGATLTAATGSTIEATQANGTAISCALGHNNTIPLGAGATPSLGNGTLSASNTRKTGVGVFIQALNPQTATPGLLTLATAGKVPGLALGVVPGVTALATATFAPTARLAIRTTPGLTSLALSSFAPSARTPRLVTPPAQSLSTSRFAPQLKLGVSPGVKALTTVTFAPTVSATANQRSTPGAASLVTATFAPAARVATTVTPRPVHLSTRRSAAFPNDALTVTDDFNRANETPIGSPWDATNWGPSFAARLTGNAFVGPIAPQAGGGADWGTPATGDFEAVVEVDTLLTGSALAYVGFYRAAPDVNAYTQLSATNVLLAGYGPEPFSTAPVTVSPAIGDLIGIRRVGRFAQAWYKPVAGSWQLIGISPEADLTGSVTLYLQADAFGADLVLDNFRLAPYTATFAPTVSTPSVATPGATALTLSTFAPTVGTPRTVTPGVNALSLSAFAPLAQAPRLVTPGNTSLVLTGLEPDVSATQGDDVTVTPGRAQLATSRFAPVITASDLKRVTPPTASLAFTAFAPRAVTPRTVTPGFTQATLTGYAPTATGGSGVTIRPPTAQLATSTFAAQVVNPQSATPAPAALELTGYRPSVTVPGQVAPDTAELALTPYAPDVGYTVSVVPGPLGLTLTGYPPIAIGSPRASHGGALTGGSGSGRTGGLTGGSGRTGELGGHGREGRLSGSSSRRGGLT